MADWMDRAVENQDMVTKYDMDKVMLEARKPLDPGQPGECDLCGEQSPRLVRTPAGMACAPCRDRRGLP